MPYIKKEDRPIIKNIVEELSNVLKTEGEYNYAITLLLHNYIKQKGKNYTNMNNATGIIECVKKEFYRVVVAPYEDEKRILNGSVSEIDGDY